MRPSLEHSEEDQIFSEAVDQCTTSLPEGYRIDLQLWQEGWYVLLSDPKGKEVKFQRTACSPAEDIHLAWESAKAHSRRKAKQKEFKGK